MHSVGTSQPLVSIIIPSYNKASLLMEMVRSIINQTYTNWELIIVDDGSDNENYSIVQDYILQDERCSLIRRFREPKNGNTCRNIGIELAKGDYLVIFDSDDLITTSCLDVRVKFMLSHPDCDYASFPYAFFFDGEKTPFASAEKRLKVVPDEEILSYILRTDYPFTVWSNIYRKSSIENIRWDENIYVYQDFDYMLTCALSGLKHEYCDGTPDYFYRQFKGGSNVSGNFVSEKKIKSSYYLFGKTLEELESRNDSVDRKEDFLRFVFIHIERLIRNNRFEDTSSLLTLLSYHYDTNLISRIESINKRCVKIKSKKLFLVFLHYKLYMVSKMRLFKLLFIHEMIKLFVPSSR